jgi:hypothetical protein
MPGRIQELRDRLPILADKERALHLETHNTCHFEPGPNGQPKYVVTDEPRLAAISHELEAIQGERTRILDKVARLEELLGHGCQQAPTGYEGLDLLGRLKMELTTHFIHKILEPGNGDAHFTLPEQAIQDPRYLTKKAEIMPQIEALESKMAKERELAALANEILSEP